MENSLYLPVAISITVYHTETSFLTRMLYEGDKGHAAQCVEYGLILWLDKVCDYASPTVLYGMCIMLDFFLTVKL